MGKRTAVILWLAMFFVVCGFATAEGGERIKAEVVSVRVEQQYDAVLPGGESALAIVFELEKDWHFYASAATAPGGMELKVAPSAEGSIIFSELIFPRGELYFDKSSGKKLEVFSDKFTVFVPFKVGEVELEDGEGMGVAVGVGIEGAVCSDIQCRLPDLRGLSTEVRVAGGAVMGEAKFALPDSGQGPKAVREEAIGQRAGYSVWFALGLAFIAGLSLNIMPCVWPVLPLIVMRIVEQARQSRGRSIAMGFAFCFGILLFFASLAGANIVLQVVYGTVLQWGDQFRNPGFVAGMALLLVVLALFMFDVFTIVVPSSISGKSGSGRGYAGAVGMGYLAAILSTPCSFAILAAAFAWAQAQPLSLATAGIMVIGVGMALPYAVLTSMPGLLNRLPKAGRWMELFKQGIGFVLLVIAVKLIGALPQVRRMDVVYFAVVLGFCVWMWGSWASYDTKLSRKLLIRFIAVALAVLSGWGFLSAPAAEVIEWQGYDAGLIEGAIEQGQPVLIKFTADWCLSCQAVERLVYRREDVGRLIEEKGVLAIKGDTTTKEQAATIALKEIYNEPGVPVSMLFLPGEEEPVRWRGMNFADELKSRLEGLSSR